jgi:hypothetical protein
MTCVVVVRQVDRYQQRLGQLEAALEGTRELTEEEYLSHVAKVRHLAQPLASAGEGG